MNENVLFLILLSEVLVTGILFVVYPSISRRGLLFGVYVGEGAGEESASAGAIRRTWRIAAVALTAACLAFGAASGNTGGGPIGCLLAMWVLCIGSGLLYIWAHRRALVLATPAPASYAAALSPSRGGRSIALVTVAVVAVIGGLVVAYAASNYDRLPERVPSHFGSSGGADAWSRKSPASVMVLPVGTLVLGVLLAGVALLTASAKRAVRIHDPGASVEAQNRFRSAMSLFLSGTALSATSLLAALSVSAIRIGIGDSTTISPLVPVLTVLMLVYAIGGSLFLSLRMGQGGSRLERAAGGNPLTDGLADNQRWKWGLFYVNPEDPSIFVEKRFGLGYTINFGNRRAVLLFLGFMVAVGLFVLVASLTAGD